MLSNGRKHFGRFDMLNKVAFKLVIERCRVKLRDGFMVLLALSYYTKQ
jgi:hypothetical protein